MPLNLSCITTAQAFTAGKLVQPASKLRRK